MSKLIEEKKKSLVSIEKPKKEIKKEAKAKRFLKKEGLDYDLGDISNARVITRS